MRRKSLQDRYLERRTQHIRDALLAKGLVPVPVSLSAVVRAIDATDKIEMLTRLVRESSGDVMVYTQWWVLPDTLRAARMLATVTRAAETGGGK